MTAGETPSGYEAIIAEIEADLSRMQFADKVETESRFDRKVAFYEKKHQRKVTRKLVISPMVDAHARPVAKKLGIEVYRNGD